MILFAIKIWQIKPIHRDQITIKIIKNSLIRDSFKAWHKDRHVIGTRQPKRSQYMKLALLITASLATATAQASGVVFNTPVTYTEPVTYAAGVTYLAPVTYTQTAAVAHPTPVLLERVIVTPTRTYAESEWHVHLASQKAASPLYPVRSEPRLETRSRSVLRTLVSP